MFQVSCQEKTFMYVYIQLLVRTLFSSHRVNKHYVFYLICRYTKAIKGTQVR